MSDLTEKFIDKLARNLSWRKKEIINMSLMIQKSSKFDDIDELNFLYRSSMLLLYAHWEGYIKYASQLFLSNLNKCDIYLKDLPTSFVTLHFIKEFYGLQKVSNYKKTSYNQIMKDIVNLEDTKFTVSEKDEEIISTRSNLNFILFEQILIMFDIDANNFELQAKNFDANLLSIRNKIAHGEYFTFCNAANKNQKFDEYKRLKDAVLDVMIRFDDHLIDKFIELNSLSN